MADWPRPDSAFQDSTTGASISIEFKPPGHEKGEYVRGLGQAITYLDRFEMSALVLPELAKDGFEIAKYLSRLLSAEHAKDLPIAVLGYEGDPGILKVRRSCVLRRGSTPPIPTRDKHVFWAYWRDLSQYDVFFLLCELDRSGGQFDKAFNAFWRRKRAKGRALTWEGIPRKIKLGEVSSGDRINCGLSMRHIGLIDSDGRMTDVGFGLLHHGKIYGPGSMSFRLKLGNCVLTNGRHVELLFWIDEMQRHVPASEKRDAASYRHALDLELEKSGIIPQAPRGRAKASFLRDEPKLWNKLGLLLSSGSGRYFFPNEGFRIDWRTCIEMVNYT